MASQNPKSCYSKQMARINPIAASRSETEKIGGEKDQKARRSSSSCIDETLGFCRPNLPVAATSGGYEIGSNIVVRTDGASRGNPGPAAVAFTIDGLNEARIEFGRAVGRMTNNQAEYRALIAALTYLRDRAIRDALIEIRCDSELMVKQVNGIYKVKNELIRPVFYEVESLLDHLRSSGNVIELLAVRREENHRPDALANLALDGSPTDAPIPSASN